MHFIITTNTGMAILMRHNLVRALRSPIKALGEAAIMRNEETEVQQLRNSPEFIYKEVAEQDWNSGTHLYELQKATCYPERKSGFLPPV